MNPLLKRYIVASLTKHFSDLCAAQNPVIIFVSEDEQRDTNSLTQWVELRIIGPEFRPLDGNTHLLSVEVDLLVTSKPLASDIYAIHNITGLLAANCSPVPVTVSGEMKFCLTLDPDVAKSIRIFDYGRQADTKTKRSSVIAIYENEVEVNF